MIPIRDDNPVRGIPVVTILLILACLGVYLWQLSLAPQAWQAAITLLGFMPGVLFGYASIEGGGWVSPMGSIFTAMFLHGGFLPLAANMIFLWIFGDNVEDRLGHVLYFVFYILCGLAATFAQLAISLGSSVANVGASGAIAGVLGAYLIMFPRGRVNVLLGRLITPMSAIVVIGLWILLQIFSQINVFAAGSQSGGGVAYMAHIGGFVAGVVLTFLLGGNRRALPSATSYRR